MQGAGEECGSQQEQQGQSSRLAVAAVVALPPACPPLLGLACPGAPSWEGPY